MLDEIDVKRPDMIILNEHNTKNAQAKSSLVKQSSDLLTL